MTDIQKTYVTCKNAFTGMCLHREEDCMKKVSDYLKSSKQASKITDRHVSLANSLCFNCDSFESDK